MKVLPHAFLASILAFSSAFATAAEVKNVSPAKTAASVQMTSQQELIDLFFAAAKIGNSEVINEFLKHGFPVDVRNQDGYTPLMMATYYGHQGIVTTLLTKGADRCARDNRGNTALMGALFKMEFSIAKQLRQVDCDAQAKKTGQKTTAEFAKVIGQEKQLQKIIKEQENGLKAVK
ncbi:MULTISPECIES: ankyrin repeat domain-containing protein [Acinetobacter]|uniref:ankyrin repeat domain-containing protein n=1 Tax=Acinetobacter TaxID=469 RepID=UPI00158C796E|nr:MULTISPECIES: ankyrin repeat domain-containing protein [unclassified Acinetobacter]QKW81693.1 ankyrin repeat domain-containing protein [Acinetobacter sp. FDAARGOS_724]